MACDNFEDLSCSNCYYCIAPYGLSVALWLGITFGIEASSANPDFYRIALIAPLYLMRTAALAPYNIAGHYALPPFLNIIFFTGLLTKAEGCCLEALICLVGWTAQ